jgi:hypothetical protein
VTKRGTRESRLTEYRAPYPYSLRSVFRIPVLTALLPCVLWPGAESGQSLWLRLLAASACHSGVAARRRAEQPLALKAPKDHSPGVRLTYSALILVHALWCFFHLFSMDKITSMVKLSSLNNEEKSSLLIDLLDDGQAQKVLLELLDNVSLFELTVKKYLSRKGQYL